MAAVKNTVVLYHTKEAFMPQYVYWLPGSRTDQVAMAKTWLMVTAVKGTEWGIPPADITELGTLTEGADTILFQAKSSMRSKIITAQCREAFEAMIEKMRFIKARWFLTPPLTPADYAALLLREHAQPSPILDPKAQPTADLVFPGIHLVELRRIRPVDWSVVDPRADYGVRIHWGLAGEPTEMHRFRVIGTPKTGRDLPNSLFTRRKNERFDLDGESGNRVYFCLKYENPSGEEGSFGPMLTAVIP
jgi:hypothetical protein